MLPHEKIKFDQVDCDFGSKYWLPIQWALSIVCTSRQRQLIDSDYYCERICEEIRCFRNNLANLRKFDWVPLPLAYPQLVYLAIHVHFFIILISKQEIILSAAQNNTTETSRTIAIEIRCFRNNLANLRKFDWVPLPLAYPQLVYLAIHVHFFIILISKQEIILSAAQNNTTETSRTIAILNRWFPLTPAIKFFFYMAWIKVAMVLINPFGEDDDDFETNALIDRNFKVGMKIADGTSDDVPKQLKDAFWNRNIEALYSEQSIKNNERQDGLVGSATKFT
ncbi:hypothetical protein LOAG_18288 [Loa loa]|uniref:Bestrophin homolog n=2 Tax=Loa loa TaxID=7209 RepID=A0A1S0UG51_LOALO|nr:hypothetical protein LOAG_18288 [Loa loa]EJD74396.1 hypothetical protein LOAG_18288 [Loa loa]